MQLWLYSQLCYVTINFFIHISFANILYSIITYVFCISIQYFAVWQLRDRITVSIHISWRPKSTSVYMLPCMLFLPGVSIFSSSSNVPLKTISSSLFAVKICQSSFTLLDTFEYYFIVCWSIILIYLQNHICRISILPLSLFSVLSMSPTHKVPHYGSTPHKTYHQSLSLSLFLCFICI